MTEESVRNEVLEGGSGDHKETRLKTNLMMVTEKTWTKGDTNETARRSGELPAIPGWKVPIQIR